MIEEAIKSDMGDQVKIMAGGYPFNVSPNLWKKVGADGWAPNAQKAILEANQWTSG